MDQSFRVIIIGAGLAGLGIAQGLKKNGINYVVVDKETEPRDRNWGVTISWSHPFIAKLLSEELFKRLPECQPDPEFDSKKAGREGVLVRDGQTGETMINPYFPGVRRLNIQKTKQVWSEDVNVKFGKNITDIKTTEAGVEVFFDDGTTEKGSIVVGADGGGSWVRRWLLGDAGISMVLPYEFLNFPVRYTAEQAVFIGEQMHPIVDVGVHPKSMYIGLFLLDKPILEKPESWIYYLLVTWPKDLEDTSNDGRDDMLVELRKRMDNWADPYKSAVAWIPDDTKIRPLKFRIWCPTEWDSRDGRVTLAGDAAHSMTFHRGQGANNALRDSERFVSAMLEVKSGEKSLKEAIEDYDHDVIARGKEEVEVSRMQTDATHDHANYLTSPIGTHGIKPTIDIEKTQKKAGT